MSNELREGFEAWAATELCGDEFTLDVDDETGAYLAVHIQDSWTAWQAAYLAASGDGEDEPKFISGEQTMTQHPIYGPLDTDEQIEAAAKRIQDARDESYQRTFDVVEKMIRDGVPFTPAQLRYAATSRCQQCGVGLAYPLGSGPFASWYCSERLLNPNDENNSHDTFPFAFYSVKSEDQPSARGATTRPAEAARG